VTLGKRKVLKHTKAEREDWGGEKVTRRKKKNLNRGGRGGAGEGGGGGGGGGGRGRSVGGGGALKKLTGVQTCPGKRGGG